MAADKNGNERLQRNANQKKTFANNSPLYNALNVHCYYFDGKQIEHTPVSVRK